MNIARIRPSKPVSVFAAIPATAFACAGFAGIVAVFGWFPQAWPIGLFLCLWTFVAGSIAGFHWINIFSASGVSLMDADIQSTPDTNLTATRLKELENLKAQSLISSEEYNLKREAILKKLWKSEQTRAANTHPRARQMLIPLRGHLSRPRPGAADEGR